MKVLYQLLKKYGLAVMSLIVYSPGHRFACPPSYVCC